MFVSDNMFDRQSSFLFPAHLVCNDVWESRVKRIKSVIKQYLYDTDKWKHQLVVTQRDGRDIDEYNVYNKVTFIMTFEISHSHVDTE
jgi:hypothetical protein